MVRWTKRRKKMLSFCLKRYSFHYRREHPARKSIKGPLAQRLVQRTHNPLVDGSNPSGPTIFRRKGTLWIGARS